MKVDIYRHLTDKEIFFNFCRVQSIEQNQSAAPNMWHHDWINNKHTLPYILEKTNRFDGNEGEFFIVWDNNAIVACGGVYISDFDSQIGIAGVRTWVKKEYRHLALNKDYLLAAHKKWCIEHQTKMVALTFNEYNKNIIQIFKRNRLGEKNGRMADRKPHHMFFNGLHEVPFAVDIQYTTQWVIYEKLDPDWDFNWSILQHV